MFNLLDDYKLKFNKYCLITYVLLLLYLITSDDKGWFEFLFFNILLLFYVKYKTRYKERKNYQL